MLTKPVRHSDVMTVRLAPDLREAVDHAARARGQKPSEWLRQAAMTVAMLEGVSVLPDVGDDIRADGKRRYARIEGGAIVDVIYHSGAIGSPPDEPF